jgi:hypothetical protein
MAETNTLNSLRAVTHTPNSSNMVNRSNTPWEVSEMDSRLVETSGLN